MEETSANKMFGGWVRKHKHNSTELGCEMTFAIYYPPAAESSPVPVVLYLSGLTCTCDNFIQKAGAQRAAAALGLALLAPDTSPRGLGIEGEDDSWDFGTGAGFYLDAMVPKWKCYRMYSYVMKELMAVLKTHAPSLDLTRMSIMGHSMGGHGALTLGLKHAAGGPYTFRSVSAFSPICNPSNCPWGQKAFTGYLGTDKELWKQYDASILLSSYNGPKLPILIDVGTSDNFFKEGQLLPEAFEKANERHQVELTSRMQEGYDHSYYFIATFVEEHLYFHAKVLGLTPV